MLSRPGRHDAAASIAITARMTDALAHRGPDDRGIWRDDAAGLFLGHRRLAIQDPGPCGHQPMPSPDGRHVIAFNGEIYNFAQLRRELLACGFSFRGHGDTEVLVAAIQHWGPQAAIARIDGMFALAVWDRSLRRLWLARDKVGKKPLYYGWAGQDFVFASELKALWEHPGFDNGVDVDALAQLLHLGYIPAPHCIHLGAAKLKAAHSACIDGSLRPGPAAALRDLQSPYWHADAAMATAVSARFRGGDEEALERLDDHLLRAVRKRMVADVPVGAFLSGGVDSSLVALTMQHCSSTPVSTFTIGFDDERHDEAPWAAEIASRIGARHTSLQAGEREAAAIVPTLGRLYDEPFADVSQIPTLLACRLARAEVTVVLGGDGGDELMMGYARYARAMRDWERMARIPRSLRRLAGHIGGREHWQPGFLSATFARLAVDDPMEVYARRVTRWRHPERALIGARLLPTAYASRLAPPGIEPVEAMMLADFKSYLADDLLCKIDRASMSMGLEVRCPLLDQELVAFAWSLPLAFRQRHGQTKWLLRERLRRELPATLAAREKQGFSPPLARWLSNGLREWSEDLLEPGRLRADGYFRVESIAEIAHAVRTGRRRTHSRLWCVLMFQAWLSEWRSARAARACADALATSVEKVEAA